MADGNAGGTIFRASIGDDIDGSNNRERRQDPLVREMVQEHDGEVDNDGSSSRSDGDVAVASNGRHSGNAFVVDFAMDNHPMTQRDEAASNGRQQVVPAAIAGSNATGTIMNDSDNNTVRNEGTNRPSMSRISWGIIPSEQRYGGRDVLAPPPIISNSGAQRTEQQRDDSPAQSPSPLATRMSRRLSRRRSRRQSNVSGLNQARVRHLSFVANTALPLGDIEADEEEAVNNTRQFRPISRSMSVSNISSHAAAARQSILGAATTTSENDRRSRSHSPQATMRPSRIRFNEILAAVTMDDHASTSVSTPPSSVQAGAFAEATPAPNGFKVSSSSSGKEKDQSISRLRESVLLDPDELETVITTGMHSSINQDDINSKQASSIEDESVSRDVSGKQQSLATTISTTPIQRVRLGNEADDSIAAFSTTQGTDYGQEGRGDESTITTLHSSTDHHGPALVAELAPSNQEIRQHVRQEMETEFEERMQAELQQRMLTAAVSQGHISQPALAVATIADSPDEADDKLPDDVHINDGSVDAERRKKTRRRWMLGCATAAVLLIINVVALLVFLGNRQDGNSTPSNIEASAPPTAAQQSATQIPTALLRQSSSPSPTTDMPSASPTEFVIEVEGQTETFNAILKLIAPILFGPPTLNTLADFRDPESIHHRSLDWLANQDLFTLQELFVDESPDTVQRLLERYALANVYFATNGPRWTNQFRFLVNVDACLWNDGGTGQFDNGIRCNPDGFVSRFVLYENGLEGMLPSVVHHMKHVEHFVLFSNDISGKIEIAPFEKLQYLVTPDTQLSGSLPTELGTMTELIVIDVQRSLVSGTIPSQIGELSLLRDLLLSQNNFQGTIPSEIGHLTQLSRLFLYQTKLTGTIPSEIGKLQLAVDVLLDSNGCSGTLPSELGMLSSVRRMFFFETQISGTIPTEIGNCVQLRELELNSNNIGGPLPSEIGQLTNVEQLLIHSNGMNQTLPTEIGLMANLQRMRLFSAQLTGTLPSELGNCTDLIFLDVGGNMMTGAIPSQIGQLTSMTALHLYSNDFSGTVPLELANLPLLADVQLGNTWVTGNLDPILCTRSRNSLPARISFASECAEDTTVNALPRTTCSCCDWCCGGATGCSAQAPQPSSCDERCVACAKNTFATECAECPAVSIRNEDTQLCSRSCAFNATSETCELRTEFGQ
mmetsp:Transcript_3823/g.10744  ORF Transcript_3823/g.10744 Transcript_3823/m.10744 type:complete len:1180 (+) Transcript_3823:64-3603(+)